MNIRFFIVAFIISLMVIYPQQHSSDKSLPSQLPLPSLDKSQPNINSEFEKALKEYEALIKKYPDKKKLYYNLGNLNYLSGDTEAALQNYRNSLIDSDIQFHFVGNLASNFASYWEPLMKDKPENCK